VKQAWDVIIIGAGAAGLMCAIESGRRGRKTLLIEHCEKIGKKILISGGGRCNFTNIHASPDNYLSENPHFCKSALSRYSPHDFIALIEKHNIAYHEKKLGQLFCDGSSRQVVGMLSTECAEHGVTIITGCSVMEVRKDEIFYLSTSKGDFTTQTLVVATGGLSIPKMGATDFGHCLADQFGVRRTELKPGLVPFTFPESIRSEYEELAGVSLAVEASVQSAQFRENMLFTHKGVSGPAMLQVSSFWKDGISIEVELLRTEVLDALFKKYEGSQKEVGTILQEALPKRFLKKFLDTRFQMRPFSSLQLSEREYLRQACFMWKFIPGGTEGYRTAEVTVGGVDTRDISSKTFQAVNVEGLFFIGEVLDVTGWLGGYNFQWAWASGFCAGQYT